MKKSHFQAAFLFPMALMLAGSTVAWAWAGDKKVSMKDLPKAVQKTVREQSKGATLRGLSKETENGKTYYEAELTVNGHGKDLTIDADGKVVEIEEVVALDSLPDAVKATLKERAGKGKILKVESVTKGGTFQFYEAQVQTGGKKSEIKVGADGKVVTG